MPEKQASAPRFSRKEEADRSASFDVLRKNEEFTAQITDQNHLGHGVCRCRGSVVFVPHAVKGETVSLRIIKVAKSYAVARLLEVLTPSPDRIEPSCAVANRCGGCVFANITYQAECEWKRTHVEMALRKAGLKEIAVAPLLTTGQVDGYRNKVQYPVGEDFSIGYYANHSHEIIPCRRCALQSRALDEIVDAIVSWGKRYQIKGVRHLYLRHAKMTDQICVCLVANDLHLPHEQALLDALCTFPCIKSVYINENNADTNVILGEKMRLLAGDPEIEDILCGLRFALSPHSFYQVNHDAAELLYHRVFDLAQVQDGDKVADLYCGAGTIGLSLIARHPNAHLVGVEIVPQAIENAKANAKRNGIENAQFYCGDALHPAIEGSDIIIVDPPRKGCSPDLIERICEIAPRKVVYVSCNPDTFARDLVLFAKGGYQIGQVTPVDLFARTGHVESVVCLTRADASEQEGCCDLHVHSNCSDGANTPEELIGIASERSLHAIALCDHNTVCGLPRFLASAKESGVEPICGVEITTGFCGKEVHILGLFLEEDSFTPLTDYLKTQNERKTKSNLAMISRLQAAGYAIDYDEVLALAGEATPNRVHVAKILMKAGYIESILQAFEGLLADGGGFYRSAQPLDALETVKFLASLRAVPVLAHPLLSLTEAELRDFLPRAKACGLCGIETMYTDYDESQSALAQALAQEFHLLPSGGSDFHGVNRPATQMGTGRGNLCIPISICEALRKQKPSH